MSLASEGDVPHSSGFIIRLLQVNFLWKAMPI
jgi:hypothetical protein